MRSNKNKKSPLFRVYYSDFSKLKTYTAYTDEDIGKTPIYEVLLIVQKDNQYGKKIVSGGDYYIWSDDIGWLACDNETKNMYMARNGLRKRFLIGVMVHEKQWTETMRVAMNDCDFQAQTELSGGEGFK